MWVKNPLSLVKKDDVDIIIELIGGPDGVAKKLAFAALKNNKHFITANKALIAQMKLLNFFLGGKKILRENLNVYS